jgi:hypothetical protein
VAEVAPAPEAEVVAVEPEPVVAEVALAPEPEVIAIEPEPVVAEVAPAPEAEVVAIAAEAVVAEVALAPEAKVVAIEPEPVAAEVALAPEAEVVAIAAEPVVAEVAPAPEAEVVTTAVEELLVTEELSSQKVCISCFWPGILLAAVLAAIGFLVLSSEARRGAFTDAIISVWNGKRPERMDFNTPTLKRDSTGDEKQNNPYYRSPF